MSPTPDYSALMHTTIEVPEALVEEARRILGFKSRTDAVVLALRELVRRERAEGLIGIDAEQERSAFRVRA